MPPLIADDFSRPSRTTNPLPSLSRGSQPSFYNQPTFEKSPGPDRQTRPVRLIIDVGISERQRTRLFPPPAYHHPPARITPRLRFDAVFQKRSHPVNQLSWDLPTFMSAFILSTALRTPLGPLRLPSLSPPDPEPFRWTSQRLRKRVRVRPPFQGAR
ncbi:hypothetical protein CCHR01_02471 [Colletotrichum chrysophilum]|uniref:Uncharacterized protein n=1 Tax=Colletotrichum chrysophilum TaxID=1836956 RepID=A0AAD9AUR0_9PEZI|nr:hypothetical protein CCHR01_02471 [Colletotrichum chrysophilum]